MFRIEMFRIRAGRQFEHFCVVNGWNKMAASQTERTPARRSAFADLCTPADLKGIVCSSMTASFSVFRQGGLFKI
jgi:hypothetical protein